MRCISCYIFGLKFKVLETGRKLAYGKQSGVCVGMKLYSVIECLKCGQREVVIQSGLTLDAEKEGK